MTVTDAVDAAAGELPRAFAEIRRWAAGTQARPAGPAATLAETLSLLDAAESESHDETWPTDRLQDLAAAILTADILWDGHAAPPPPVEALEIVAERAGGPAGRGLGLAARIARDPQDVRAAIELKSLIVDSLALSPNALAIVVAPLLDHAGEVQHLANHLFHHGDKRAAAGLCRLLIARGRGVRDTYLILAFCEAAFGGDPQSPLELGLLRFQDDQVLLVELAKQQRRQGELDAAAENALRAAACPATSLDILTECFAILLAAKRIDDVVSLAERTLGDGAEYRPLLVAAADAAHASGRFSAALRLACRALRSDPQNRAARHVALAAGARLWRSGGREIALSILREDASPSEWWVLVATRLDLLESMPPQAARAPIREFAAWALSNFRLLAPDLRLRLTRLCVAADLPDRAADLIRRAAESRELGRYDIVEIARAAGVALDREAEAASDRDLARALLAAFGHGRRNRDLKAADALPLLAAALDPASPAARLNAGFCELGRGEVGEAESHFGAVTGAERFEPGAIAWPLVARSGEWPRAAFPSPDRHLRPRLRDLPWPRITLVTPSLDQGEFIEDCILSVLNQDYPNLEYAIVDGGSTDRTPEILHRYRDRVSRVIVRPGMGQTEAINMGFSQASGEILGWLNTDDLLLPGALHNFAAEFVRSRADVLIGDCLIFRDGSVVELAVAECGAEHLSEERLLDIYRVWLSGQFLCQPEVMLSRAAFERIGGRLDESLHYAMDYDLWLRLSKSGATLARISWPVAAFRKHRNQKTAEEFACFSELRQVQARHSGRTEENGRTEPAAPAVRAEPAAEIELRIWDALPMSPLAEAAASGRTFRTPDGRTLRLTAGPDRATAAGLALHLFGAGGALPDVDPVREALQARPAPALAWIWNAADLFVAKRRISELFDIVIPADAAAGSYLANRCAWLPELPEAATALVASDMPDALLPGAAAPRADRCGLIDLGDVASGRLARLMERIEETEAGMIVPMSPTEIAAVSGGDPGTFLELLGHNRALFIPSVAGEIPFLAFDAMLAGALPLLLVGDDAAGTEAQESEPAVERFSAGTVEDLAQAAAGALARLDEEGNEPTLARREAVITRGLLAHRIEQFLAAIEHSRGDGT